MLQHLDWTWKGSNEWLWRNRTWDLQFTNHRNEGKSFNAGERRLEHQVGLCLCFIPSYSCSCHAATPDPLCASPKKSCSNGTRCVHVCFSGCKPLPFTQRSVVPALALFGTLGLEISTLRRIQRRCKIWWSESECRFLRCVMFATLQCCDVSWSFLSKARVVGRLCRRFLPPDASHPVGRVNQQIHENPKRLPNSFFIFFFLTPVSLSQVGTPWRGFRLKTFQRSTSVLVKNVVFWEFLVRKAWKTLIEYEIDKLIP